MIGSMRGIAGWPRAIRTDLKKSCVQSENGEVTIDGEPVARYARIRFRSAMMERATTLCPNRERS